MVLYPINHHMPPSIEKQIKKPFRIQTKLFESALRCRAQWMVDGGVLSSPFRTHTEYMEIFVADFRLCNPQRITIQRSIEVQASDNISHGSLSAEVFFILLIHALGRCMFTVTTARRSKIMKRLKNKKTFSIMHLFA